MNTAVKPRFALSLPTPSHASCQQWHGLHGCAAGLAIANMAAEAKRLRGHEGGPQQSPAMQAARAFPDRIGLRRPGDDHEMGGQSTRERPPCSPTLVAGDGSRAAGRRSTGCQPTTRAPRPLAEAILAGDVTP